ncbi:hypothetical protein DERP_001085 [Dermatophagoides pteronyssinus]|uniref:Uncharacterized protein n=1 Tax=Dermatophagoides pteronyssinus TaxID=6956 RepID=A0ABQ8JE74_DERPT|nr:hypothetical protein DERP_001085 [Dermatophagoides pteronyssinus]
MTSMTFIVVTYDCRNSLQKKYACNKNSSEIFRHYSIECPDVGWQQETFVNEKYNIRGWASEKTKTSEEPTV